MTEYKIFNLIDLEISLELKDFMNFYLKRKDEMKRILCDKLEVDRTLLNGPIISEQE